MDDVGHFRFVYGIPEAQEVFRNVPEARGSVLAKYQPVASHGTPFVPKTMEDVTTCNSLTAVALGF